LGRIYVCCVIVAGGAAILQSGNDLYWHPLDWQWLILAGLTLLSGSITVKLPSIPATISVSETFVFTAVMLFGPSAGTITVALDGLIISLWLQRKKREAYKALFNVAAPALSLWCSAQLFFSLARSAPLSVAPDTQIRDLFGPLVAFTLAYFLLNSVLIAVAISLEKKTPAFKVWRENFSWLSLNFFFGASVAVLLVAYLGKMGPGPVRIDFFALGIIIPLLIISYLTYKTSMGRLEDTTKHLSELNLLYISTIETLAMWIDAKDQITHGHIRRVQMLAVDLAKQLGVRDPTLIKAIEAAALLHDMGKLAVPEHILNKPGKLTAGEFEKMKLHASIGAQILSSIDFPYPVVPIVRHHHENWDGSGYPDGLIGTDIPIGARILAVVDCFDALTSDRPYRPRLSSEKAVQMVAASRGKMYDPLVVDAFLQIQRSSGVKYCSPESGVRPAAISESGVRAAAAQHLIEQQRLGLEGVQGRRLIREARTAVPVALAALYLYEESSDELVVGQAAGDGADDLKGYRLRLGHGVSGWVAATRRTMANSDAALDLGESVSEDNRRLKSCLSLPIALGDKLLGVLALYSSEAERFSDEHVRTLERKIQLLLAPETTVVLDTPAATRLPGLNDISLLSGGLESQRLGLVVLRLESGTSGGPGFHPVAEGIVDSIKSSLRTGDLLIRTGVQEFIALLPHLDPPGVHTAALRMQNKVTGAISGNPVMSIVPWRVLLGVAASPQDGGSLTALIGVAHSRLQVTPSQAEARVETIH